MGVCPRGGTEESDEGTADKSVCVLAGEGRVKGKQVMKKHLGYSHPSVGKEGSRIQQELMP